MQEQTHIHNTNPNALRAGLPRRPPASPRLRRSCAEPSRRRYRGILEASSTRLCQEPPLIPAGGSWVRAVVHHGGHSPGLLSEPPCACRLRPIGPPTGAIADNKNSLKKHAHMFLDSGVSVLIQSARPDTDTPYIDCKRANACCATQIHRTRQTKCIRIFYKP